jgi:hypothetical protein
MAKRTPKTPKTPESTPGAETVRKVRSGTRTRARRDVASEMAAGQDQAAAASDEFVGVDGDGNEPVQSGPVASLDGSFATPLDASSEAPSEPSSETQSGSDSTDSISMSSSPSDEDIRMRAYHRYLERGGGHGLDFEDWLAAERDLKAQD